MKKIYSFSEFLNFREEILNKFGPDNLRKMLTLNSLKNLQNKRFRRFQTLHTLTTHLWKPTFAKKIVFINGKGFLLSSSGFPLSG
jgi:hypothetical protein